MSLDERAAVARDYVFGNVRSGVAKRLTILGSTGSIGKSTLAIVKACPDAFSITALVAGQDWKTLSEQALVFQPSMIGIADEAALGPLRDGSSLSLCHTSCFCKWDTFWILTFSICFLF